MRYTFNCSLMYSPFSTSQTDTSHSLVTSLKQNSQFVNYFNKRHKTYRRTSNQLYLPYPSNDEIYPWQTLSQEVWVRNSLPIQNVRGTETSYWTRPNNSLPAVQGTGHKHKHLVSRKTATAIATQTQTCLHSCGLKDTVLRLCCYWRNKTDRLPGETEGRAGRTTKHTQHLTSMRKISFVASLYLSKIFRTESRVIYSNNTTQRQKAFF